MTFRVGMKVVCVNQPVGADSRYPWGGESRPEVGEIYTIREVIGTVMRPHLGVGLLLHEIHNPLDRAGREFGFYSYRFRPLTDTKTQVSFTIGADPESKHWDNRKKVREKV